MLCSATGSALLSAYEYASPNSVRLRDAVTLDDGSKIGIGSIDYNSYLVKIKNNGDIAWAKVINEFSHNSGFHRLTRSGNSLFLFQQDAFANNNEAFEIPRIIKTDEEGNILLVRNVKDIGGQFGDITATDDGGFIAVFNAAYGAGYTISYVVRFSKDLDIIWRKELKHFVMTPVYRSITTDGKGVYLGQDSYDSYNLDKIGIEKLDFNTGSLVWTKRFAISGNILGFNRVIVNNDSVFAFLSKSTFNNANKYLTQMVMLTLSGAGKILSSKLINNGNVVFTESIFYYDKYPPSVSLAADSNFIIACPVEAGSTTELSMVKINRNGNIAWGKSYPSLNKYSVLNIHSQGKGMLIIGSVLRQYNLGIFYNSFLLKTDSVGEVTAGATGSCKTLSRQYTSSSVAISEVDPGIDSVINTNCTLNTSNTLEAFTNVDATLYCNEQATCANIMLAAKPVSCNPKDTMVYFISNNNCGALIKWKYDTAFFHLVSLNSDSLKLISSKAGASVIKAEIETPCFKRTDSLTASVSVTAAQLDLGKDTVICAGTQLIIHAGYGYKTYLWSNASADSVLEVTMPGKYFVTVKDNCGNTATDTLIVSEVGKGFKISGTTEKCNSDSVQLSATAGFTNYEWSPLQNLAVFNNTAVASPSVTTVYYARATASAGCIVKDSFQLTVKTSPAINLGSDTTLCYNASIRLSASTGFNQYTWNTGSNSYFIDVANPGLYSVNAVYNNGCVSIDTLVVSRYPFTAPHLGNDTSLCSGNTYRLTPGVYANYIWSNNQTTSSISIPVAGTYWVTITDMNGCIGSDTIAIVNLYQKPGNFLADSAFICYGESIAVGSTKSFMSYNWSTGQQNREATFNQFGNYYLLVTDQNGCIGSDTISIAKGPDCIFNIYFPSAFSPNNDMKNDRYKPTVYGQIEAFKLTIYNRYGAIVFSTNDPGEGWNGIFNNTAQPVGNYVYTSTYKFAGLPPRSKSGNFVLIR